MRSSTFIFLLVLITATLAPTESISAGLAGAKSLCAERWPRNSAKQKTCVGRQIAANKRIVAFIKRYDIIRRGRAVQAGRVKVDRLVRMFNLCFDRWEIRRHDTYDDVKVARCLHKHERAYLAKLRAERRSDRVLGRLEAIAMIKKMPNISLVAWADEGKDSHLNVVVQERGQDYASDSRAYCDILKTKGVRDAKVSVWSADAKKKSPPKEVLLTHRRC